MGSDRAEQTRSGPTNPRKEHGTETRNHWVTRRKGNQEIDERGKGRESLRPHKQKGPPTSVRGERKGKVQSKWWSTNGLSKGAQCLARKHDTVPVVEAANIGAQAGRAARGAETL